TSILRNRISANGAWGPSEGIMSDMEQRILRVVIGPDPADRLDKALAAEVPEAAALSRSRLARLIAGGAITRDGVQVVDQKARVAEGEVYEIALEPARPV